MRPSTKSTRASSRGLINGADLAAPDEAFVDEFEIAKILNVSNWFVREDRRKRKLIPFSRLGRRVIYLPSRVRRKVLASEEGAH